MGEIYYENVMFKGWARRKAGRNREKKSARDATAAARAGGGGEGGMVSLLIVILTQNLLDGRWLRRTADKGKLHSFNWCYSRKHRQRLIPENKGGKIGEGYERGSPRLPDRPHAGKICWRYRKSEVLTNSAVFMKNDLWIFRNRQISFA